YATAEHLAALRRLGPCPLHRYSFAPIREAAARETARNAVCNEAREAARKAARKARAVLV
ncbi:MAG: hypothetical protein V3T18_06830, partial [Pseudomonadales bacterium]